MRRLQPAQRDSIPGKREINKDTHITYVLWVQLQEITEVCFMGTSIRNNRVQCKRSNVHTVEHGAERVGTMYDTDGT